MESVSSLCCGALGFRNLQQPVPGSGPEQGSAAAQHPGRSADGGGADSRERRPLRPDSGFTQRWAAVSFSDSPFAGIHLASRVRQVTGRPTTSRSTPRSTPRADTPPCGGATEKTSPTTFAPEPKSSAGIRPRCRTSAPSNTS